MGRQRKVKKDEKSLGLEFLAANQLRNWVETKKRGLKIKRFSACWTY